MDSFAGSMVGSLDEPLALDEQTYAGRREVIFFFVLGALCVPPLFFLPLDPPDRTAVAAPIRVLLHVRHAARSALASAAAAARLYTNVFSTVALLRRARLLASWLAGSAPAVS